MEIPTADNISVTVDGDSWSALAEQYTRQFYSVTASKHIKGKGSQSKKNQVGLGCAYSALRQVAHVESLLFPKGACDSAKYEPFFFCIVTKHGSFHVQDTETVVAAFICFVPWGSANELDLVAVVQNHVATRCV